MKPGEVVADRFEVAELAGQGGMGAVFRARDRQSGQPVALKALTDPGGNHVERFLREAQVLHDLHHPGIVRYIAHGKAPSGELWMAMEWVEGESVSQRVARQPFTVPQACFVVLQIARGLAEAHRHGVVHRDIKPSNVFVHRTTLEVKVLDFGIARLSEAARLTGIGMMLGTPGYMAPEQARGSSTIDSRADIFSLGCLFFKCLTGRPPFMSEDVRTVLAQVLFDPAPVVSSLRREVPPSVDALVAQMLAKKPADRPNDGSIIAAELERIYSQLSGASPEGGGGTPRGALPSSSRPPTPQRTSRASSGPKAIEIPIIVVPLPPKAASTLVSRVAPASTEVDMPVAGDGPAATQVEMPLLRQGAATDVHVPVVSGPAGTEVEVPLTKVPTATQIAVPSAIAWVKAGQDAPTAQGPSPFAASAPGDGGEPFESTMVAEEDPARAPAEPAAGWDPPTFVRRVEELPEPPAVVQAFVAAREAAASDDLDGVLEATTRGLEAVAGPASRGRLLALQAEARLWRGQHDLALEASSAALAALSLDHVEWGMAAAVSARASSVQGDSRQLTGLANLVLELDQLHAPPAIHAAAVLVTELARTPEDPLGPRVEEKLRAESPDQRDKPVVQAAVLAMKGAAAGRRGDLSVAAQLSAAAANLLRASGRVLESLYAGLDAARWRGRLGGLETAHADLTELHAAARAKGARWLEVEAALTLSDLAARLGRIDEALGLVERASERILPAMGERLAGRASVTHAELLDLAGRDDLARAEIQRGLERLRQGPPQALARTLQSHLALGHGRKAEALESAKAAVAYFDAAPSTFEGELGARLALAKALFAGGLNDAGRSALTRACDRLRQHTAAISSTDDRATFLKRISENRQLLELASWWLGQAVG